MVKVPSADKVIEFNTLALAIIRAKKADKPEVLSKAKIMDALQACEKTEGDTYDKAVILLKGLVQKHAFASGNRRTAFITTRYFLETNGERLGMEDKEENARIMLGIRENYYSDSEIKEWIRHGKIREFKR